MSYITNSIRRLFFLLLSLTFGFSLAQVGGSGPGVPSDPPGGTGTGGVGGSGPGVPTPPPPPGGGTGGVGGSGPGVPSADVDMYIMGLFFVFLIIAFIYGRRYTRTQMN